MRDKILSLYGERYLRKSAIRHDDYVVFEQVLSHRVGTILEIGTYRGCTTAELSRFCDKVITIDLVHGRIEKDESSIDRHEFWKSLGVANVDLRLVRGNAEKRTLVESLDFDFAFVDGSHEYEDVELDFSLVRKCGRVLFHDYYTDGPNPKSVYRFVNSIRGGRLQVFGIFALWTA